MNQVEVKLDEVHVKFNQHKDEAYKLNFNIITYQKTFESNISSAKCPKLLAGQDQSFVSWSYDAKNQHLHLQNLQESPDVKLDMKEESKTQVWRSPDGSGIIDNKARAPSMKVSAKVVPPTYPVGETGSHNVSHIVENDEAPFCTVSIHQDIICP